MSVDRLTAIAILDDGHRSIHGLADGLPPADLERPATIGGGDWSIRDLVGHLTAWEEHALEALAAWRTGRPAPIQQALRRRGLNAVNAESAAADRERGTAAVMRRSETVHGRLVEVLSELSDADWIAPPTRRSRRGLGSVVGSIVGGPGGPFRHAWAHLADLERAVESLEGPTG